MLRCLAFNQFGRLEANEFGKTGGEKHDVFRLGAAMDDALVSCVAAKARLVFRKRGPLAPALSALSGWEVLANRENQPHHMRCDKQFLYYLQGLYEVTFQIYRRAGLSFSKRFQYHA
jgi:hypothetical protein